MPTHPSKHESYSPKKPDPMRNLSEFAVADTPVSSYGPEYSTGAAAGDYLQARFAPISPQPESQPQRLHHGSGSENMPLIQTQTQTQNKNQSTSDTTQVAQEGQETGGVPTALERGVRGGSGPVNETERRATRYVDRGEMTAVQEGKQNENVDAEAQMEMYPEGKVAEAVRVKRGTQRAGGGGSGAYGGGDGAGRGRPRAGSMSMGVGEGASGGGMGAGGMQGWHGRGRGEVSLEPSEAGLERKKQQQAASRKQVMDARRRGEDVDGRGTAGPSGRQLRAELD